MIASSLTTKERIIYSAISDGITNSIAIKNVTQDRGSSTVHDAVNALVSEGSLTESCYTYRDPTFRRPRKLRFYRLTLKGLTTYFPSIAPSSPTVQAWLELYPNLTAFPSMPSASAYQRERLLRVLESELFCSAAGVLTTLDHRPTRSPVASAAIVGATSDKKPLAFADCLRASVQRGSASDIWNALVPTALLPSDPYSFYRAKEITTRSKPKETGSKDIAVIRSQYVGMIANQNRGFLVYRAPRYNGMSWNPKIERKVQTEASSFCSRVIPHCHISLFHPIQEAVFFYQTNQELLNVLTKSENAAFSQLGQPFHHIYALPFSSEGLAVFRALLSSDSHERDCIGRVCEADPSFAPTKGISLYQLNYFESVLCLIAFPLEIRKIVRLLSACEAIDYSIIGYQWQKKLFDKLLPDIPYIGMDV